MGLGFVEEIKAKIPDYIIGLNRIMRLSKELSQNEEWQKICMKEIRLLISKMAGKEASDMDIGGLRANKRVWFRVYGQKEPDEDAFYTEDEATIMLLNILSEQEKEMLFKKRNVDFSLSINLTPLNKYRLRGDIYFERDYIAATFRMIRKELFKLEDLNFPSPIVKRFDLEHEKTGLILVTGITGSGKSSTLDSIIDMNNHKNKGHIVIIGNPIEYIHKSDKCLITHREIGKDVINFEEGTIQALRQDPDIIVVGEMRDPETVSAVLEVTDSGHKVFTTLHTSSAVESIHRIIAMFPANEQDRIRNRLADTLKVVVSQKLVPNRRGSLTLAKEILSVDYSVQAALRNNNITELFQMMTEGRKRGMYTMQQNLLQLVRNGTITPETAMDYSNNKQVMLRLLKYS